MFKSAVTLAGLAATVLAESSSCPATTTKTSHETYTSTEAHWETVTWEGAETSTVTPTAYTTTATVTESDVHFASVCKDTSTKNVVYTSTAYEGDYTSSSLRALTSCQPKTSLIYDYPGTTTATFTVTKYGFEVTANSTVTLPTARTVYEGASTTTNTNDCTATVTATTATANSTVTQQAKCAPTNLIGTDGLAGQRYRFAPQDGIANYGSGAGTPKDEGAQKDVSACCQACQEDSNCAASIWVQSGPDQEYYCQHFNRNTSSDGEEGCGLGFSVYPGDLKIAQSGSCGYVAQIEYAGDECKGETARECSKHVGGYLN